MNFIKEKKKVLLTIAIIIIIIAIPLTIALLQHQQDIRQHAASATTLSFSPATSSTSPLSAAVNGTFSLDMKVDPGTNAISVVRYEIVYDATKFAPDTTTPFTQNKTSFPTTLEGPIYTTGKISGTVSIGSDYSKAITVPTTVATVTFKALATTGTSPSQITYSTKSQLLSVSSQDQASENVLSSTTPAYVQVSQPTSCTLNQPTDVMLLIDKSGSMGPPVSSDDRIGPAKTAANNFVNILYQNSLTQPTNLKNQVGVVSFSELINGSNNPTTLNQPLTLLSTQSKVTSTTTIINAITIYGRTCIQCAVQLANQEILAHGRAGVKKVVILMTDGGADAYSGHITATQAVAEAAANTEIDKGHAASGTIFFTIGLGTDVNTSFLKDIASRTGGQYYYAPTGSDLSKIYQQISTSIAKGIISGKVFNDTNSNAVIDTTEKGLSGWQVKATLNGQIVSTVTTDSAGDYSFEGLCDGVYSIGLASSTTGWKVTTSAITATITNGNSVVDRNIGLVAQATPTPTKAPTPTPTKIPTPTPTKVPTPTPTKVPTPTPTRVPTATPTPVPTNTPVPTATPVPQATKFSFGIYLHGIGHSGDNANPTAFSLSNQSPVHQQRTLTVEVLDTQGATVETKSGVITYDPVDGNFKGVIDMGTALTYGSYNVRVKTPQYLRKQLAGIQTVAPGQTIVMPQATLVTGDINGDNVLNILDYDVIVGCYSDFAPPVSCSGTQNIDADLTDDGRVDQFDYNLFLRDLSVQNGD